MEFFCSFSDFFHLTKEPMVLSNCGHYICIDCFLNNQTSTEKLECKTCGTFNETKNTSVLAIGDSLLTIEKQLKSQLNRLKGEIFIH